MKNSVKIALGIVAGSAVILLAKKRKALFNKNQKFTAPDGNQYGENQMYRTADGEVFKNGKKIRFETPENTSANHNHVEANFNNQHLNDHYTPNQPVSYHQKGTRHH